MTDDKPNAVPVPAGRLLRLGRLGGMTAGVAGKMALSGMGELARGRKPALRDMLLTPANITRITEQLAQMRGAAMKMGQLISLDSGEILPPDLARIMARLRDDAHIMPAAQLRQVLDRHWPSGWLSRFAKFDVRPIAAASIGQVHRAQLKDGRDLAIKVQYPGVAASIDSDVANVGVLLRLSGLLPKGFALAPYLEEAAKQLHNETDYLREAAQLQRFGQLLGDDPQFIVPAYAANWSNAQILAMDYCPGDPIETAFTLSRQIREVIATSLIDLTLRELFDFGLMQTDPNFANYRYDPQTGRIVLLDFGATHRIDPQVAAAYRRLLLAGLADDTAAIATAASEMGFITVDMPQRHRQAILHMIDLAFAALRSDDPFDFSGDSLSRAMQTAAIALAKDGFIPPLLPIDVLLLQRKFGGMYLLIKQLGVKLHLRPLLSPYLS